MAKQTAKLSLDKQRVIETYKKIKEYKVICEANIVSLFWKDPELFYGYGSLDGEDFTENMWKVYWEIAHDVFVNEGKTLEEITVGFYLEKHLKLKEKYEEYGGYDKIISTKEYVDSANMPSYVAELHKWNAVISLLKRRFPIHNRIKDFVDMTAQEIYDEYFSLLNDTFIKIEDDVQTYSMSEGIYDLIDELDDGLAVGLLYHDMPLLTKEVGGMALGNITLIGALSNVGKSTFIRSTSIPACIENNEPLVIMLNEDGHKKWQRELLVWVANNIYKEDIPKYTVRDGKYKKAFKDVLIKCADWMTEKDKDKSIIFAPFKQYKTSLACKIINKYSSLGVKYFMLDTFKLDAGSKGDNSWLIAQQSMVDINDIVKPESKNLHIVITFQLTKGSAKQRYYTQDNIGVFKNIIDPSSTCIMLRFLNGDEHRGCKNALEVYKLEGKNKDRKTLVHLDPSKHYQIAFIIKNREGAASQHQIVFEHDMSKNIIKEIGITNVQMDW